MSDNQVIQYVLEQQQAGKNQAEIVQNLLKRGVTLEQLQKLRKKITAQKEQLGAVSIDGTSVKVSDSRMRTDKQLEGESYQKQNNYMVRSQARGVNGRDNYTKEEEERLMNDAVEFFDLDSLAYYRGLEEKTEDQVFGRNLFNNAQLSFQPNMNIATPANYRLGAGDAVIIDVWGASQETFEGTISPDGTVTIEGIGPIKLAGLTVAQANGTLKSRMGKFYQGSSINLTVGDTRSIIVQVMGEVKLPGTYTLSSLSTAFNALYAAGGISDIGTLRDIKVYRTGRQIASIDVYDYILNGNSSGDIRLQDNDIIVVGSYDCLVRIKGKVKRPMYYEMKSSESVSTILSYAGGFTGDAYKKNVRLIRKSGAEYSIHTIGEFDMIGFNLNDGDSIFVDSVVARYSNMVEIRGAVYHPGMYQIGGSISGVRDLIRAAEGIREDAFLNRAVMHRQREDMSLEVIPVDVKGLLAGNVPDIPLKKNDVLYIHSRKDDITSKTITISGEVLYPGTYQYADNTTLEDIVLQAGGLTDAASLSKVDVFRRHFDPTSLEYIDETSETFSFALREGFVVDGEQGFVLQPFDVVVVRKSPTYSPMETVTVTGCVNFEGNYLITNRDYKLSDLIRAAGGLSKIAYAKGAHIERALTEEERKQQEASLRASQIELYEESMKDNKQNISIEQGEALIDMKMNLKGIGSIPVDLEAAIKSPGCDEDIMLRPGDKLIVPEYSASVKIIGDVMFPVTISYKKGESLDYYIKRAGGYGDNARKKRVYAIYMNGSAKLLSHHSKSAIQPGCQIVVPSKKNKNKMSTAEILSIGSSSASIAAVVATIANILK
ncbi:MAG: SLBB domain-containing protein [Bacteroidaceae bacterium]|nr:SLBB domain-containing protein [Bacteroidaceae bacterium]